MSRMGRLPVAIPAGVTVEIAENNKVTVKGQRNSCKKTSGRDGNQTGRRCNRSNKTKRFKEDESVTWSYKEH